jgi:hypothetical protein
MFTPAASAAGSLWRIAAQERDQEHHHGRDHRVAEVGGVGLRDAGPAHLGVAEVVLHVAEETVAAVGEVGRGQHDGDRAGEHQRDQGEVEPAQPQRGQTDQRAQHHRDQPGQEQDDRERQAGREGQPRAHPRPQREHGHLPQRHHADPADQQPEPERHDREDRHLRDHVRPVGADLPRQHEQHQSEQHHDHDHADALAAVQPGRRPGGRFAGGRLGDAHV